MIIKRIVVGGGNGQPFIADDYLSVQRALDINTDAVLIAKNGVTGVYDKDSNQCEDARRYKTITFNEVIERHLEVADQSAFILACDFNLPFYVFDFKNKDCIKDICECRDVGTYIAHEIPIEWY